MNQCKNIRLIFTQIPIHCTTYTGKVLKMGISDFFRLIHVPDLTGTFVADHTGPDRCPRVADFRKELAIRRLGDSPENLIADTGSMFADMSEHNTELFLCIILFKLLLQP